MIEDKYDISKYDDIELDELKQLAKSRGFYLKPITKYNKKELCPVCKWHRQSPILMLGGKTQYVCEKCGFSGRGAKGLQKARDGWNKAVEMYYEQHKED